MKSDKDLSRINYFDKCQSMYMTRECAAQLQGCSSSSVLRLFPIDTTPLHHHTLTQNIEKSWHNKANKQIGLLVACDIPKEQTSANG